MRVYPGFDLLRLIAAAAVVFSHSFLIAEGTEAGEPVKAATGQILGLYGVYVFFVLSGLLISESARRSRGISAFAVKRIGRIVPAFVLCNLVLVIWFAPLFATDGRGIDFLVSGATWRHLWEVLTFRQSSLWYMSVEFYPPQGEGDLLPRVVNGVLWTIRQEFTCYGFVALAMVLGFLGRPAAVVAAGIALGAQAALALWPDLWSREYLSALLFVAPSFAAGVGLQAFAREHRARGWVAAILAVLVVALSLGWNGWEGHGNLAFPALMAYPLLWVGQQDWPVFRWYARWGDPSYGTYLWGYPIQQGMRAVLGPGLSGYALTALCLPLAVAAGYASWHLVESPALRLVGRRRVRPGPAEVAAPARPAALLADPQRVGTGASPR